MKQGVTIQLERETVERMKKIASETGSTLSAWIRMIILKELKEHKNSTDN